MENKEMVLLKDIEIEGFAIPKGNYTLTENNMYHTLKYRHPMGMDTIYNIPNAIFKNHIKKHIVEFSTLKKKIVQEGSELEVVVNGEIRKYSVEAIYPTNNNGGTHYVTINLEAID